LILTKHEEVRKIKGIKGKLLRKRKRFTDEIATLSTLPVVTRDDGKR